MVLECDTFDEFKPKYEAIFLDNEVKKYEKMVRKLEKENNQLKDEVKSLKKEKKDILNSKSWKLTKPFRDFKKLV